MEEEIYRLIPWDLRPEVKMFTENEFANVITLQGKRVRKSSEEINLDYNHDRYNPKDGEIIEATDRYAAFLEAYLALKNGITSQELEEAKNSIRRRHQGKMI
jgi:putative hydrolase of HD superfamily